MYCSEFFRSAIHLSSVTPNGSLRDAHSLITGWKGPTQCHHHQGEEKTQDLVLLKGKLKCLPPYHTLALLICNLRQDQGRGKAITVFLNNESSLSDYCT